MEILPMTMATTPAAPLARTSGVLLHPTSLPGRYGIGDLGTAAYHFVDWLHHARQSYWQVLPLGPTSYGDSPYQSLSAMAGNPYLISFDRLLELGWLTPNDMRDLPPFPNTQVDYGWIYIYRAGIMTRALEGFQARANPAHVTAFRAWCQTNAHWLEDYALFMACKGAHGGAPWHEWEPALAHRQPDALKIAARANSKAMEQVRFEQWVFQMQWEALRAYAAKRGIRFVGDLPIFVAHDSSDVWANPELFALDSKGKPLTVAGVPPDAFSATGQLWGNPHYLWDVMEKDSYHWWIRRFEAVFRQVDIVRIDHFRGFEAYWSVAGSALTAEKGEWVPGPGLAFFRAIEAAMGKLPIIAEDLGVITPPVDEIRRSLGLPGMKIVQFAFGDDSIAADSKYLPHNYGENYIVYTGTHDNNTTIGWFTDGSDGDATDQAREHFLRYIDRDYKRVEPSWDMMRLAMGSVAYTCIVPLQDVMGLAAEGRMNTPGTPSGNWTWRYTPDMLTATLAARLGALTALYGRAPHPATK
ncbi:MAG: 4-alpha-glucanotransferase [Chloroflexota bacterium]|nr:4-alpha-glucanotransferase [Chloroflexota bacterium]